MGAGRLRRRFRVGNPAATISSAQVSGTLVAVLLEQPRTPWEMDSSLVSLSNKPVKPLGWEARETRRSEADGWAPGMSGCVPRAVLAKAIWVVQLEMPDNDLRGPAVMHQRAVANCVATSDALERSQAKEVPVDSRVLRSDSAVGGMCSLETDFDAQAVALENWVAGSDCIDCCVVIVAQWEERTADFDSAVGEMC